MKKTALITGASRGIGRAIALKLSENFNVIINYNNSEDDAKRLLEEITSKGGSACIFKADVSNEEQVKNMVDFSVERYKKIDVLINNAGISEQLVFCDITSDKWKKMIDVNLNSVYNVTYSVLPGMISSKSGKIVNISSVWGICGASCEVHYSTSKSGIIGFTKALAKEVAPSGINVNAIAPGVIETDMCNFDEETMNMIKDEIPLGRIGTPNDVANAVHFLCSEESDYITGEVINISGGYVI